MSGCHGEAFNTPIKPTARTSDGKIIFDGTVRTLENSFLEPWLPHGQGLVISFEAEDKKTVVQTPAFANSET